MRDPGIQGVLRLGKLRRVAQIRNLDPQPRFVWVSSRRRRTAAQRPGWANTTANQGPVLALAKALAAGSGIAVRGRRRSGKAEDQQGEVEEVEDPRLAGGAMQLAASRRRSGGWRTGPSPGASPGEGRALEGGDQMDSRGTRGGEVSGRGAQVSRRRRQGASGRGGRRRRGSSL